MKNLSSRTEVVAYQSGGSNEILRSLRFPQDDSGGASLRTTWLDVHAGEAGQVGDAIDAAELFDAIG